MSALTLAQLLTPETQDVVRARIIARLATAGAPTTSWVPSALGGPENLRVDALAATITTKLAQKMADSVAGRFLEFATGDFLTFLAKKFYLLDRRDATFTIQNVLLSAVPTAGTNDFAPLDLWVKSPFTGNRYQSIDGGTLGPGLSLPLRFQAELPGASYSDVAGTVISMVTAPAGITCINEAPSDFLPATLTGPSTGTVTAAFAVPGVSPDFDSIRIQIMAFGEIGTATFRYSTDGGDSWSPIAPVPTSLLVGGQALVTFANGSSPSFIQGSIYTLLVGSAILQQGSDAETDDSLRTRCRARWPSLSDVPTAGVIALWAQAASPEVDRILVDADPNTPGGILVTIASQAGPASAAAQIAVGDYVLARLQGYKGVPSPASGVGLSPEESVIVRPATAFPVTPSGQVSVPRANVAAVQIAADTAWNAYLRGLEINGEIIFAKFEEIIMDAGAVNVFDLQLNGSPTNLALGAQEVAVPADGTTLANSLTWRPV